MSSSTLIIDSELERLIPQLSHDELELLEKVFWKKAAWSRFTSGTVPFLMVIIGIVSATNTIFPLSQSTFLLFLKMKRSFGSVSIKWGAGIFRTKPDII